MFKVMIVVVIFLVIQIIPYGKNHTNPEVLSIVKWDSPKTKELFDKSCLDCHSNKTKWPWYSNIAPISWIVYNDVEEAREHFNISMIGHQKHNELDETYEEVELGDMPPFIYLLNHSSAKLNETDRLLLINGLKNTFK